MAEFIKGLTLCRNFYNEAAKPILDKYFPDLEYSAALIGYGSDVLGYDDPVSRDHMWGPRFYMFLRNDDLHLKDNIFDVFGEHLPYTFMGYSVNFTEPDINDNGVQHPEFITDGKVRPLIFIQTFESFLTEQLGTDDVSSLIPSQWLSISEHRLLSIVKGELFYDGLNIKETIQELSYYPETVRLYLAGSCWESIAQEQAFMKRCYDVGDDMGSRIIAARICDRLMRLCYIYEKQYAPYSKWFGRGFTDLTTSDELKGTLLKVLSANDIFERENELIAALLYVSELHNTSCLTSKINCQEECYFGRNIKVIFCDKISTACYEKLKGTELEGLPLFGSMSQIGNVTALSDETEQYSRIQRLYE